MRISIRTHCTLIQSFTFIFFVVEKFRYLFYFFLKIFYQNQKIHIKMSNFNASSSTHTSQIIANQASKASSDDVPKDEDQEERDLDPQKLNDSNEFLDQAKNNISMSKQVHTTYSNYGFQNSKLVFKDSIDQSGDQNQEAKLADYIDSNEIPMVGLNDRRRHSYNEKKCAEFDTEHPPENNSNKTLSKSSEDVTLQQDRNECFAPENKDDQQVEFEFERQLYAETNLKVILSFQP